MISTCDNRMVVAPPEGRALWLLHDGTLLHLMASTSLMPARLTLSLQDCFDATVLRVDLSNKRLFIRPSTKDDEYITLCDLLKQCTLVKVTNALIKLSSVYICLVGELVIRGVVTKVVNAEQSYLVYGIDVGEEFLVDAHDFYELNIEVRDVAPLSLCVVLSDCPMLDSCEEFAVLLKGCCCVCSLDKLYPSAYPEKVKELYPPAIVSHLYHKDNTTGKFLEISCNFQKLNVNSNLNLLEGGNSLNRIIKREVLDNYGSYLYSKRRISRSDVNLPQVIDDKVFCHKCGFESWNFQFPKYRVHLPFTVNVMITRKITFATYMMRDTYIITKVQAHIKNPCNSFMANSSSFKGIACIARVKRLKSSSLQLYRAILLQRSPGKSTYLVYLVDYGQRVTCDYDQLFDLQDQPPVILETPVAAFKCRVRRIFKQKESRVNKLLEEEKYRICLTLKRASKTYWGIVLPQALICGGVSLDDIDDCGTDQQTIAAEECSSKNVHFFKHLKNICKEETVAGSVNGEDGFSDCGDANQDLRLLKAKVESLKYCENMTVLSAMLQQLSCRVDAMEVLAGCNSWNSYIPAMYGCSQPSLYVPPNSGSSVAGTSSQGTAFPVTYLPQFYFDPNVPPPTALSPRYLPHFRFQNQGLEHFPQTRTGDNKYDVEYQHGLTSSGNPAGSIVHEKCIYEAESAAAGFSCCENPQIRTDSNAAVSNSDFDSWRLARPVGNCGGDSLLHELNQTSSSREQPSSHCSYANALKKGLRTKNRAKVVVISSSDKKVRNVVR